jgi:hypothetical protein
MQHEPYKHACRNFLGTPAYGDVYRQEKDVTGVVLPDVGVVMFIVELPINW